MTETPRNKLTRLIQVMDKDIVFHREIYKNGGKAADYIAMQAIEEVREVLIEYRAKHT